MADTLQEVQLTEAVPLVRKDSAPPLIKDNVDQSKSLDTVTIKEHDIDTAYGNLHVTVHGVDKGNRPAIVTYHDIGLNHKTCFDALFADEDMQEIIKHFCIYHIDAPGQYPGAPAFPEGYQYPSMEQLAEMVPTVLHDLGVKNIIGVGVGAGAYVLAYVALHYPSLVEGVVLINIDTSAKGWFDWAASKLSEMTHTIVDVVLNHHFTQTELHESSDLVQNCRRHVLQDINHYNLALFFRAYNSRKDLDLQKASPTSANLNTIRCPALLVVGDSSNVGDAVVECNSKLDPTKTSLLKMSDCGGLPQVAQPNKLTEAFKYFVQGMGHMPSSSMTRLVRSRTQSRNSSICSMEDGRMRSRTRSQCSTGSP